MRGFFNRSHNSSATAVPVASGNRIIQRLRTPGHRRSLLVRRALAVVLVLVAIVIAVRGHAPLPQIVVFEREVQPGTVIAAEDVGLRGQPEKSIPDGALTDLEEVVGKTLVSGAMPGEPATKIRFISSELTARLLEPVNSNEPAHMVPISLADPEIISLLHHGDTVSVISEGQSEGEEDSTTVIADQARIIVAREATSQTGRPTVLLALPASTAHRVASASLATALTVVLTGERARPAGTASDP